MCCLHSLHDVTCQYIHIHRRVNLKSQERKPLLPSLDTEVRPVSCTVNFGLPKNVKQADICLLEVSGTKSLTQFSVKPVWQGSQVFKKCRSKLELLYLLGTAQILISQATRRLVFVHPFCMERQSRWSSSVTKDWALSGQFRFRINYKTTNLWSFGRLVVWSLLERKTKKGGHSPTCMSGWNR